MVDGGYIEDGLESFYDGIKCFQRVRTDLLNEENLLWLRSAYTEIVLTYEEEGNMEMSRQCVRGAIENKQLLYWTDEYQRAGSISPGLDARPFWEASDCGLEWVSELEANAETIYDELMRILPDSLSIAASAKVAKQTRGKKSRFRQEMAQRKSENAWAKVGAGNRGSGMHDGSVLRCGDWQELILFGSGGDERRAPLTCKLLRDICPQAVTLCEKGAGEVIFSMLKPGSHIRPHCAPTNHRLTCHLGLSVPGDQEGQRCEIRVGKEWRGWSRGKALLFDDSFEHEVWNDDAEQATPLPNFMQQ